MISLCSPTPPSYFKTIYGKLFILCSAPLLLLLSLLLRANRTPKETNYRSKKYGKTAENIEVTRSGVKKAHRATYTHTYEYGENENY